MSEPIPPPTEADLAIDLGEFYRHSQVSEYPSGRVLRPNPAGVIRRCHAAETRAASLEQERDRLRSRLQQCDSQMGRIANYFGADAGADPDAIAGVVIKEIERFKAAVMQEAQGEIDRLRAENTELLRRLGSPDADIASGRVKAFESATDLVEYLGSEVGESPAINHPDHYGGDTLYETIKVIEAWGWGEYFCLGNAVKYLSRAGKKSSTTRLEDLKKARWYIDRLTRAEPRPSGEKS